MNELRAFQPIMKPLLEAPPSEQVAEPLSSRMQALGPYKKGVLRVVV